ncbi:related to endoglucanase I precursor [Rhynchosporium secalis]|uniref:Related to endoglucanase I n=1 Tax=Rhynchosporium secalis TaxID=38038 RepID=A0A1E1M219_RHYSE|nr:related to endoglucanase I precursor [Rhynchosporium secalis]
MKLTTFAIPAFLAATAAASPTPEAPGLVGKRPEKMCSNWGSVVTGGFTIYHNPWGASSGTGSQCTTFNSISPAGSVSWSTEWTWANGKNSVKSYSNVALEKVNKPLSAITSIPSTWSWSYTGSNMVADVAYDLWLAPTVGGANKYEIMIWLGSYGGAGPISSSYNAAGNPVPAASAIAIGGTNWDLYKGPNGDVTVFSFVAPSNQANYSGDLMAFFNYLTKSQGVPTSSVVTSLQSGTEPFTGQNAVFTTTGYTIKVI